MRARSFSALETLFWSVATWFSAVMAWLRAAVQSALLVTSLVRVTRAAVSAAGVLALVGVARRGGRAGAG